MLMRIAYKLYREMQARWMGFAHDLCGGMNDMLTEETGRKRA